MKKLFVALSCLLMTSSFAAGLSGRYAVPVANPDLAPYASFDVKVENLQVQDRKVRLEVLLPFELSGSDNYRKVFEGEIASDGQLVLKGQWVEGEPEAVDRLNCAVAPSQETTVCLAQWPTLKGNFNEIALRDHLLTQDPSMPRAELEGRVAVSRVFGGDAIGVLEYRISANDLGYPN